MNTKNKSSKNNFNATIGNTVLAAGWIPVEQLPTCSMKVKWLCEDGVEDVGFYYSEQKEFASWDLCSEKPITHWKPFEDFLSACS